MYSKTTWVNGQEPAINAENLNHMEDGIKSAHDTADEAYQRATAAQTQSDWNEELIERTDTRVGNVEYNTDVKFRKNLMYGKIEGTSPLTAKTLSGTTELTLKGRCEQTDFGTEKGGWDSAGNVLDPSFNTYIAKTTNAFKCVSGDTIVAKYVGKSTNIDGLRLVMFNGSTFTRRVGGSGASISVTVASSENNFYVMIATTTPLSIEDFKPYDFVILVNGEVAQPIPTPTTPIPIEYAHATDSANLVDFDNVPNWYLSAFVRRKVFVLKPNTDYTISQLDNRTDAQQQGTNNLAWIWAVSGENLNFTTVTGTNGCLAGNPRVVRTDESGKITVGIYDGMKTSHGVMLNEGTSALPYEPFYKATNVESFRNIFSGNNVLNAYIYNGNVDIKDNVNSKSIYEPCKPNTSYTIRKESGKRFRIGYTKELPANGVRVYGIIADDEGTEITITTSSDAKYLVSFVFNDQQDTVSFEHIKSTITLFETLEHDSIPLPTDLLGLPNAQDELKEGWVTRRVGIAKLSEVGYDYASVSNNRITCKVRNMPYKKVTSTEKSLCICDKFSVVSRTESTTQGTMCLNATQLDLSDGAIFCASPYTDSVANWNYFLASNEVYIVYELATPTNAPADRIELPTYNEQTTFNADYCEISADVAQNGLDVIDERTKEVYAEEETLIGTYLGKPLYRKVIHTRTPSTVKTDGLVYEGIKKTTHNVINMYGAIDSGEYTNPLNMFAGGDCFISTWVWDYGIQMRVGVSLYADKPCEIVVEYTKASASGRSANVEPMMLAEEVAE